MWNTARVVRGIMFSAIDDTCTGRGVTAAADDYMLQAGVI